MSGAAAATYATNAINTLQLQMTQTYFNLKAIFGPGGTYNATNNQYYAPFDSNVTVTNGVTAATNASTNATVTLDTYNPSVYDPNFVYLLSAADVSTLTNSIHVWTTDQLIGWNQRRASVDRHQHAGEHRGAQYLSAQHRHFGAGQHRDAYPTRSPTKSVSRPTRSPVVLVSGSAAQLALASAANGPI